METKIEYGIKRVGFNGENDANAQVIVQQICAILGISPERDSAERVFVGTPVEVMKSSDVGTYGHIGLQTPNVELAIKDSTGGGTYFCENTIRPSTTLFGMLIMKYVYQRISLKTGLSVCCAQDRSSWIAALSAKGLRLSFLKVGHKILHIIVVMERNRRDVRHLYRN